MSLPLYGPRRYCLRPAAMWKLSHGLVPDLELINGQSANQGFY